MQQFAFRQIFIATGALALLSVIVFWSFNELSDLFGGPQAQFKHAIAAIGFLLVIKLHIPRDPGHPFHGIAVSDSTASRPLIPRQAGRRFHGIPATF